MCVCMYVCVCVCVCVGVFVQVCVMRMELSHGPMLTGAMFVGVCVSERESARAE